tara:strand:+ start:2845 stop:3075 length:231 start_codon:yes stop_codon:yes gene_type:complete
MEKYIPENDEWIDVGFYFNTKKQLEFWLEGDDFSGNLYGTHYYEWRAGYRWKPYDSKYVYRFVWNTGKNKGEEVKV